MERVLDLESWTMRVVSWFKAHFTSFFLSYTAKATCKVKKKDMYSHVRFFYPYGKIVQFRNQLSLDRPFCSAVENRTGILRMGTVHVKSLIKFKTVSSSHAREIITTA